MARKHVFDSILHQKKEVKNLFEDNIFLQSLGMKLNVPYLSSISEIFF